MATGRNTRNVLPLASLYYVLSLVTGIRTNSDVILQFDGSFRPPRDVGFASIPRRQAVCAACISRHWDYGIDAVPLAVGTEVLPVSIGMSSQHAEYEGLLMGLEYLSDNEVIRSTAVDCNRLHDVNLIIQGDCKTVIDQLMGNAVPRKLESLYHKTTLLLNTISKSSNNITISFQHIPRDENLVADNLCNNLMNILAFQHWNKVQREIDARKTTVREILGKYLDPSTSTIQYSMRPPLYVKLALYAHEIGEYEALVDIGQQLVEEAKRFHAKDAVVVVESQKCGVCYQIQGWRALGNDRKAEFLERKHRNLLSDPVGFIDVPAERIAAKQEWDSKIQDFWKDVLNLWFDVASTGMHGEAGHSEK